MRPFTVMVSVLNQSSGTAHGLASVNSCIVGTFSFAFLSWMPNNLNALVPSPSMKSNICIFFGKGSKCMVNSVIPLSGDCTHVLSFSPSAERNG